MIRPMTANDWKRVSEIYKQGMEGGTATFNTECPSYEEWDQGHVKTCRFVYEKDGNVVGWVAISPSSSRCAYKGCVEMSVYVDQNYRGHGVGTALVNELIQQSEKASIGLHKKCGFREIGYRERIAKDRFGEWQNTTLMEYRAS